MIIEIALDPYTARTVADVTSGTAAAVTTKTAEFAPASTLALGGAVSMSLLVERDI